MQLPLNDRPVDDQPDPSWAWWEALWPYAGFCADYAEIE